MGFKEPFEGGQIVSTSDVGRKCIPQARSCYRKGSVTRLFVGTWNNKGCDRAGPECISSAMYLKKGTYVAGKREIEGLVGLDNTLEFNSLGHRQPVKRLEEW